MLQRSDARTGPPCEARAFKQALLKKFDKLEFAWDEMDLNGDGALQFQEFVRACRGMQFQGNLRMIFEELTGGEDTLTPEALDPGLPARLVKRRRSTSREPKHLDMESSGFQHDRRTSAATLGEVHQMLQRSDA